MDLIDRKYRILQAIIDDYIMTALPVGSRTISRKYEQKLSSATIRNEMSDLEELGYLDSPHTSAGRIPSYKAYRLYVDQMIHPMPLSEEETTFIKSCFDHRINQVEELSAKIAKALIEHDALHDRRADTRAARGTSFQPLAAGADFGQTAAAGAGDQKRRGAPKVLDPTSRLRRTRSIRYRRIISSELEGCPMSRLPAELTRLAQGRRARCATLLGLLAAQPPEKDGGVGSLVVGGRSNLLSFPEYSDVDRAKELLSVLETREKVVSLLSHQGEMEISVVSVRKRAWKKRRTAPSSRRATA